MNGHELHMFLFMNGYPYLPVSAMGPVPPSPALAPNII